MPAHSPVATPTNLPSLDHLVEEVAVAININGINHAVMMATPDDLDDFAVGFLFGEGIIRHNHEVHDIQVAPAEQGIVLDVTIANRSLAALAENKRRLTGVTGCGICGVAAVEQALPALPVLPLTPPLDGALLAGLRPQMPSGSSRDSNTAPCMRRWRWMPRAGSSTAGKISGATMPSTS